MKRFFPLILAITAILLCAPTASMAGQKTDLMLKMFKQEYRLGKPMVVGKAMSIHEGRIDLIVKAQEPSKALAKLKAMGASVGSVNGKIITVRIAPSQLEDLEAMPEIVRIEPSLPLSIKNDTSRKQTGVDKLQDGHDGIQYTGKDVVVGIIDTGLDFSREDFLGSDGGVRLQYIRFQTIPDNDTEFEIYHCAKDKIVDETCIIPSNNDYDSGHGTHVAGVAVGNHHTYTGVARDADIMFVRNTYASDVVEDQDEESDEYMGMTFSSGLLDGINHIFKKADIIDKPAVVNISQGTHVGAHDGTSLLEQGIEAAVAGQYAENGKNYGRIVVAAAGNEHVVDDNVHDLGEKAKFVGGAHATVNVPDGLSRGYRIWVLNKDAPIRNPMLVDVWLRNGQAENCSVAAFSYLYFDALQRNNTADKAVAYTGDLLLSERNENVLTSDEEKVALVLGTDPSDMQNGKPRALVAFTYGYGYSWSTIATDTEKTGYVIDIVVRASGGNCNGDMWIEGGGSVLNFMRFPSGNTFDVADGKKQKGYTFQADAGGDSNSTVCLPATGSSVIAVGAYLSEKPYGSGKSEWTSIDNKKFDATDNLGSDSSGHVNGGVVGERTPFSSIGPTADGRIKPDVLAPGDPIISVLPTDYNVSNSVKIDATHYKLQGTSQASPHVAGIVALMLQKNNRLTQQQVTEVLRNSASSSESPNNEIGYGKVNAVKAVDMISADSTGYSGTGDLKTSDIEEDATSTSGNDTAKAKKLCGVIPGAPPSVTAGLFLAMSIFAIAAVRRKRR